MDKYPVLAGGETVGELTVEAAASDTVLCPAGGAVVCVGRGRERGTANRHPGAGG